MIIRHSRLKPMNGFMFLMPVLSLIIVVVMFFLHAETKKHLSGQLIYSGVDLPEAEKSSFYSVDKIVITITSEEKIFLDDKLIVDIQDLTQALTVLKVSTEKPFVILWADKKVSYQKIIDVMEAVHKLELKLLFVTKQKNNQLQKGKFPVLTEK